MYLLIVYLWWHPPIEPSWGSCLIFVSFTHRLDSVCGTMGRRKSKRKPPPKKKMTGDLETQFTCPFCNHEKSCDVKMERSRNTGIISCTVCLEEFQTPITYLSEPVDVYSDWIDACESANQ
uniref:Transcription elongation factor 1 homolog n=2 Tax=Monopterus albus TaxID=43700 RepID=A0A3Q3RBA8_MONAL